GLPHSILRTFPSRSESASPCTPRTCHQRPCTDRSADTRGQDHIPPSCSGGTLYKYADRRILSPPFDFPFRLQMACKCGAESGPKTALPPPKPGVGPSSFQSSSSANPCHASLSNTLT